MSSHVTCKRPASELDEQLFYLIFISSDQVIINLNVEISAIPIRGCHLDIKHLPCCSLLSRQPQTSRRLLEKLRFIM